MIEQLVSLQSDGTVKSRTYDNILQFGYTKNRGVYGLRVAMSGEWSGLITRVFWHTPDSIEPPSSLVTDGFVAVPALVTSVAGTGCITFEGSDGTKTVTSADLRYRVSGNSGTEDGFTPEPDSPAWEQLVELIKNQGGGISDEEKQALLAVLRTLSSSNKAAIPEYNTLATLWGGELLPTEESSTSRLGLAALGKMILGRT